MNDVLETIELESQKGFKLELKALVEHLPINDNLMEKSLVEDLIKQVDSGELIHFCACVVASKGGIELGTEYLGACFEKDLESFKESGYLEQMIEAAIKEAKETTSIIADDANTPKLLEALKEAKTIIYNLTNGLEKRSPIEVMAVLDKAINKANPSIIVELIKVDNENTWTCTDPDNHQYGRMIREGVYEFKEFDRQNYSINTDDYSSAEQFIETVFDNSEFWKEMQISLVDYNEVEIEDNVSGYYGSLDNLKKICGVEWMWIVAECIFEQKSGLY